MDKQQLKQNYEKACNDYLRAFCEKHEFSIDDAFWVGDDVGGIALVGDINFCMATIRTDIDEDAPKEELMKYYDYIVNASAFKMTTPNFRSWIHGCPRTSKEWFERMYKMHDDFAKAVKEENERVKKENEENKF